MDAAGRAIRGEEPERDGGTPLRLRHAPTPDPVESVVATFLNAAGSDDAPDGPGACGDGECPVCTPGPEFKPLGMRCPQASSVVIGVEPSGRVCLEVQVGSGAGVTKVLAELERAERWLRGSAHGLAVAPVAGRVDMSVPMRRRVVVSGDPRIAYELGRAGVEVQDVGTRHRAPGTSR